MTCAAVFLIWANWPREGTPPEPPLPPQPLSLDGAHVKGSWSAPLAVIEYSDFECPFCSRFANEVLPDLDRAYIQPGTVLFAFRHLPIERVHENALNAAVAADCAGEQGHFWDMHDQLFKNPKELSEPHLASKALLVGLEPSVFEACVNAGTLVSAIREERERAASYGITVTPAFLFGQLRPDRTVVVRQRTRGAVGPAQFKLILDGLLRSR